MAENGEAPEGGASEGKAGNGASGDQMARRGFLENASGYVMAGSLVGAYGTLGFYGGQYLYPAKGEPKSWLFVGRVADLTPGEAISYETPTGARVTVTRSGDGDTAESFLALSSTCPHLGCKVLWEPQHERFFCPCHNGVFAADGSPRTGPPADAGQSLLRYPLEVREGMLFIEVATGNVASADVPPSEQDGGSIT